MEIEKLTKKDVPLICDWHKEHVKINFPDSKYKRKLFEEKILEYLDKKDCLMIKCIQNKEVLAWLWLIKVWDEFKDLYYCDLHYIHVNKIARGQGVGKSLMFYTDDWAKKNGCKEIRLGTSWENYRARKMYEYSGYIKKRILMEKKIWKNNIK
jgi:GNAT superfamily N-acetyltransferase